MIVLSICVDVFHWFVIISQLDYHIYFTSKNVCYVSDATMFKQVNINVTTYRFRSYLLLNHYYIGSCNHWLSLYIYHYVDMGHYYIRLYL